MYLCCASCDLYVCMWRDKNKLGELEDVFRKELQKLVQERSGNAGGEQSTYNWHIFVVWCFWKTSLFPEREMDVSFLLMTPLKIALDLLNTVKRKCLINHVVSQDSRQAQEKEKGDMHSQSHRRPIKGQILIEKCAALRNETMLIRQWMTTVQEEKLSLYRWNCGLFIALYAAGFAGQ
jgi:hypothetical protein